MPAEEQNFVEIAVLTERVSGLQSRVLSLETSLSSLESTFDTKLDKIDKKLDDLRDSRSQATGVVTALHWAGMMLGPISGAVIGAWFARHGVVVPG